VSAAQKFVVLGSDGAWRGGLTAQQVVDKLYTRLPNMDTRRDELAAAMRDEARLAILSADKVRSMRAELDGRAHEEGALADVLRQVGEAKRPRAAEFTLLLVRLLQPTDKAAPAVYAAALGRAASTVEAETSATAGEATDGGDGLASEVGAATSAAGASEAAGTSAAGASADATAADETVAASDVAAEEVAEELDEEEVRLLALKQRQREEEAAREAEARANAAVAVDFF